MLSKLHVDKNKGLDQHNESDLAKRKSMYSVIEEVKQKSYSLLAFVMGALEDTMLQMLIVVALISMVLGVIESGWDKGWIEGASIMLSVTIVIVI